MRHHEEIEEGAVIRRMDPNTALAVLAGVLVLLVVLAVALRDAWPSVVPASAATAAATLVAMVRVWRRKRQAK